MPRAHLAVVPVLALVVAVATGCTQQGPSIPDPTTPSVTTTKAVYPLKVQRGCVEACATNDDLTVQSDGGVIAQVKGRQVECTVDDATLTKLNDAALGIQPDPPPTFGQPPPPPPTGDPKAVQVWFRSGNGSLDQTAPAYAAVRPLLDRLLADVNAPEGQRKICT